MVTIRQVALALHVLGLSLWLGGTLALTRAAAAADRSDDPAARRALWDLSRVIHRTVCAPWMSVAWVFGFVSFVLAAPRRDALGERVSGAWFLVGRGSFWVECAAGCALLLLHYAIARRIALIGAEPQGTDARAAQRGQELDGGELPEDEPVAAPPRAHRNAAPLRRIQRAVLVLALVGTVAAYAR
jgi:hypothetical protein